MPTVKTSTPPGTPRPIGPYSHIAQVGSSITIGGTMGVDPSTGQFTGNDIGAQTRQILDNFAVMLASVDSDLAHVLHININLTNIDDFDAMNLAYVNRMGDHRPARTVVGVQALPKTGALLSMNLTAVARD
jgi:2-iminobutanoate/2-iminopropanoate deaminase